MRSPKLLFLSCAAALAGWAVLPWSAGSDAAAVGHPVAVPAQAPASHAQAGAAQAAVAAARFVPNQGQWHDEVAFGVLGDTTGWLHRDGFTLRLERHEPQPPVGRERAAGPVAQVGCVVRTRFDGTAQSVDVGEPLPGTLNFLRGADPKGWRSDVPCYASVQLRAVQPGIDVVFRPLPNGEAGAFEYDLLLAPGADVTRFVAHCEGAESLRIDAEGRLCVALAMPDGTVELVQRAPIAWQDGPAGRRPLRVEFRLVGADGYGFVAADLDPSLGATVDPGVVWSTLLGGGSSDSINDLVWRPGVGIWVGGWAGSMDFPTTTGAYRTTGQQDGYVARLDEAGSTLVYGTYLGGSLVDEVRSLDIGPGLQPTVVGFTHSLDFPITPGAYQSNYAGASLVVDVGDAFVTHLTATGGGVLGSTYLGGMFDEIAEAVVVDAAGNACVAGWTASGNFPTTPGSWQPALGGPLTLQTDGFLARIAPNGASALYCTYAGGQLPDQLLALALDPVSGDVIAAGWSVSSNFPVTGNAYRTTNAGSLDMVVLRLNAAGNAPVFSTYLGGVGEDLVNCVKLANDGSVWLGGLSNSSNFPTTVGAPQRVRGGADDAVISRLNAAGSALVYSTLFGGSGSEQVRGLAIDGTDLLVVGETTGGIVMTPQAFQASFGGGGLDGFAAHYTGSGAQLAYSSYFGGANGDVLDSVVLANGGLAVLGGWSFSADFPVTAGVFQTQLRGIEDGVLLKLDLLSDLGDGLELTSGSEGGVRAIGSGEHELLVVAAANRTGRELQLEAMRILFAGRGDAPSFVQRVRVFLDPPGQPGTRGRLVAGPFPLLADDQEISVPLQDVQVPAGGSVTLRVVVDVVLDAMFGTVELACAAVDASAWTLRASGAGTGPAVRVLGTGRVAGPVLLGGALPGDADGDGGYSVFDLRQQCARLGETERLFDTDGDGVLTTDDVDFTRAAMLGRPTLVSCPLVVRRGEWFTVQGVFPTEGVVEATLGGRSPSFGRLTPRELTLRVDATQTLGLQGLQVTVDGRLVVARTVQVQ